MVWVSLMPASKSIKGRWKAFLLFLFLLFHSFSTSIVFFSPFLSFFAHSHSHSLQELNLWTYLLRTYPPPRFPVVTPFKNHLIHTIFWDKKSAMDSTITKATPTDQDIQERLGNEKTHSRSTSSGSTVLQGVPSAEVTAGQIDPEKAAVGSFTQAPTASTSTEIEEARSSNTNMAPPDGGYGWVVVGACFLNNFSMLGIMFSWGIFQQLYKDEVFPGQTSAVSWIGTLAFGFMYIVGGVCSLFAAKIGYRKMILMGSVFVAGGCVGASFATQVRHERTNLSVFQSLHAPPRDFFSFRCANLYCDWMTPYLGHQTDTSFFIP